MDISGLLTLLIYLVILALIYWFVTTKLPILPPFKVVVDLIFLLIAIVLLLSVVGLPGLHLGRAHVAEIVGHVRNG